VKETVFYEHDEYINHHILKATVNLVRLGHQVLIMVSISVDNLGNPTLRLETKSNSDLRSCHIEQDNPKKSFQL